MGIVLISSFSLEFFSIPKNTKIRKNRKTRIKKNEKIK